jgi:hypothetical protein
MKYSLPDAMTHVSVRCLPRIGQGMKRLPVPNCASFRWLPGEHEDKRALPSFDGIKGAVPE